jgi:hypothetical protein
MSTATAPHALHLHWSRWFHCESSFSLSLVPNEPGIFAIAECGDDLCGDGAVPRPGAPGSKVAGKLTLNIIQVKAADDLFHELNRLYSHDCPMRERLEKNRCFIRYAAIDDAGLRHNVTADLQQWLDSPGETDSPFVKDFQRAANPEEGPYRTRGD